MNRVIRALLTLLTLGCLAACGGGGGSPAGSGSSGSSADTYTAGVYQPESHFAGRCSSSTDEDLWLRSWTHDLYLWYSEVPDLDPASYAPRDYFNLLKTSARDAAGEPKDKFHFYYDTSYWQSLSTNNADIGYGLTWSLVASSPPRKLYVAFVDTHYGAFTAGLSRGLEVVSIDGVDFVNAQDQASVDKLNAGMYPAAAGETHTFVVQNANLTGQRSVTLTAQNVTDDPVPVVSTLDTATGKVGYLLFSDQLAQAETKLIGAVNTLSTAGVTDLVLDMRYNGGGYLDIASELAYMIAGPAHTAGQTFEQIQFNSQHPSTDPVTGKALAPTPFHATTQGYSTTAGAALPTLNLSRVFVLTTSGTCSASEAVINGLQGVGVTVYQIGSTTCGKPYGFYPQDNCGTTYFSIEFRGVNAQGFGDYPDGFTPAMTATTEGATASLPGCQVDDDFNHQLGDPNEGLLYEAMSYRSGQSCSTPPGSVAGSANVKRQKRPGELLPRSPLGRGLTILRGPSSGS